MPPELVIVCESIHAVLALERALLAAGIACDLAPVPRRLRSDCGMVVTVRPDDLASAATLLLRPELRILGCYRREGDDYVALSLPPSRNGG